MKHVEYVILETPKVYKDELDPVVIGGIGEKKSNGGVNGINKIEFMTTRLRYLCQPVANRIILLIKEIKCLS